MFLRGKLFRLTSSDLLGAFRINGRTVKFAERSSSIATSVANHQLLNFQVAPNDWVETGGNRHHKTMNNKDKLNNKVAVSASSPMTCWLSPLFSRRMPENDYERTTTTFWVLANIRKFARQTTKTTCKNRTFKLRRETRRSKRICSCILLKVSAPSKSSRLVS